MTFQPKSTLRIAVAAGALMLVTSVTPTSVAPDFLSAPAAKAANGGNGNGGGNAGGNGHGGGNGNAGGNGNSGGNGNGGGNGNAGGNGNGGGHGTSGGHGQANAAGQADDAPDVRQRNPLRFFGRLFRRQPVATVEERGPQKTRSQTARVHEEGSNNIRAQMGALNSVHASANAFAHASPNSRVGLLAAYAEARAAASADIETLNAEIEALQAELDALDASATAEIADLEAQIADREQQIADLNASVLAALEAAANKSVTPEVQAAVDAILAEKGLIPAEEEDAEEEDEAVDEAEEAEDAEEDPQEEEGAEEGSNNIRAQMGALNSVHASANAFAHASPNSRVGLLAAYAEARAAASADIEALNAELEALQTELDALDASATAEIADLEAQIADREQQIADLNASVLAALEAAANKSVTPEVQAAVDAILAEEGLISAEGEGSEEDSP